MAAKPPQVTVSRPSDTTKGLFDRPLETFTRPLPEISWCPALVGRGGSVSRRDHNQAAKNHPQLTGAYCMKKAPLERQPLFGREGSGGRGASLREAASPPRISRISLTRPSYNISSFDRRRRCAGSERASRLFRSWSGWGCCRDRPSSRAQFARSRRLDAQRK